jgi:hypothetical protein
MSDKKAWEKQIDGALAAWPPVKAADESGLAEKTLNKIRASFPPKSKLSMNDDALMRAPLPATDDDQPEANESEEWQEVSQDEEITGPAPIVAGPDATIETQVNPFADVTQEIRPEAQRTLREKSRPDFTRDDIRSAVSEPERDRRSDVPRQPTENQHVREKSSQIDVPTSRASSIPPPSSGVARSAGFVKEQAAESTAKPVESDSDPTSQKKAEDRMGQVERQRDRTSFKDLAKLAATPPNSVRPSGTSASAKIPVATPSAPAGVKSDSGVVDLQAAALSDPQGAERAKSTPLASGSLFDDDAPNSGRASVSPPSMSGEHVSQSPISAAHSVPQQMDPYSPASVRPSAPPASASANRMVSAGPHSAVAAMQQPQQQEEKKSRGGVILFSLIGVAAVAAAGVFYVHSHSAPVASGTAQLAPVAANDSQPAATQQPAAVAQANQPATTDSVSPTSLPTDDSNLVAQNSAKSGKPVAHAAAPKSGGKPSSSLKDAMEKTEVDTPTASAAVADTKAATPAATKDEAPPPVGGSANLQSAMQTAAGPSDSTTTQAAATGPKFAAGSVPQRPSQGALSSAIGRSLPDARACLGPDDGVSYATVVFESGGGVQNVTLSGFASNKPAGACIITALKKATVGPFAEPTYTAKITVRP